MKAIAIPYVIALILGVIAIGILAYWLINQSSKTTTTGSSAECQARYFSYCLEWQNNDKNNNKKCDSDEKSNKPIPGCNLPTDTECQAIGLCKS